MATIEENARRIYAMPVDEIRSRVWAPSMTPGQLDGSIARITASEIAPKTPKSPRQYQYDWVGEGVLDGRTGTGAWMDAVMRDIRVAWTEAMSRPGVAPEPEPERLIPDEADQSCATCHYWRTGSTAPLIHVYGAASPSPRNFCLGNGLAPAAEPPHDLVPGITDARQWCPSWSTRNPSLQLPEPHHD